jgi:hypothetical protein
MCKLRLIQNGIPFYIIIMCCNISYIYMKLLQSVVEEEDLQLVLMHSS